jgi:uroporphyrinogen-III synthase
MEAAVAQKIADRHTVQEIAVGPGADRMLRKVAGAAILGPEEGIAVGRAVAAERIQIAVAVEVVQHREVLQVLPDGLALPVAADPAGIGPPPGARGKIGKTVAVQIAGPNQVA